METKYGFKKLSLSEFEQWLKELRVSRTVLTIQQHHTYIPSYILFDGDNHFERQKAMKDHHINANGWADIGQHFTIFPDGVISKLKMYKKWQCWMYNFWQYAMYRFNILLTISILLFYFIFFIKKSLSVIHSVTVPFKLYHLTMIKQSVKYCCCQHLVIKCFCPLTGGFVGCDYH